MLKTTFAVDAVEPASELLPEVPFRAALTSQIAATNFQHWKESELDLMYWLEAEKENPEINYTERIALTKQEQLVHRTAIEHLQSTIQGVSAKSLRLVESRNNPFVEAIHRCYAEHRPLVLTPDGIWLQLCQGFCHHINANAERLRSKFVTHQGKKKIIVRRDDFVLGESNPWHEAISTFGNAVDAMTNGARSLFTPNFSTTTLNEQVAADVLLLAAMQEYADYELHTLCGIPNITLEGTLEDWQTLAQRAQTFAQYDLTWWASALEPVLAQFIAAKQGTVDQAFWQTIYKEADGSGGPYISGWMVALFPYLNDENKQPRRQNPILHRELADRQRILGGVTEAFEGLTSSNFPSGICTAPFIWNYYRQEYPMSFDAGFVGIKQDHATLALQAEIGWCVRMNATHPSDQVAHSTAD